jgi:hypothetical protein
MCACCSAWPLEVPLEGVGTCTHEGVGGVTYADAHQPGSWHYPAMYTPACSMSVLLHRATALWACRNAQIAHLPANVHSTQVHRIGYPDLNETWSLNGTRTCTCAFVAVMSAQGGHRTDYPDTIKIRSMHADLELRVGGRHVRERDPEQPLRLPELLELSLGALQVLSVQVDLRVDTVRKCDQRCGGR